MGIDGKREQIAGVRVKEMGGGALWTTVVDPVYLEA